MRRRGGAALQAVAPLAAVFFVFAPITARAQSPAPARHPVTVEDFLSLHVVSDPQLSPDGKSVAFTITTPSLEQNKNVGRIWLVGADGANAREATNIQGSEHAPRWSPDGRVLAFLAKGDSNDQVWRMPAPGGTPTRVTAVPTGISDFYWSPDGRALYVVTDLKWPAHQEIDARNDGQPTDARIWTDLFYRHWTDWRAGLRQHVLRVPLAESGDTAGPPVDVTPLDRDVPTLALGGADVAFSPSGDEMAVVYNPDSVVATSTNNDIFVMAPDGSGRHAITTSHANDHSPTFSPDGRTIAYLAMRTPGFEADRQEIVLYDRASGRRRSLTPSWMLSPSTLTWTPDGHALMVEVEERGTNVLYRIDVPSGRRTRLVAGGVNTSLQLAPAGGGMVFLRQSGNRPAELWHAALDGSGAAPLTHVNDSALAALDLPPVEPFGFVGAHGDSVFGWTMKPPGFDRSKRYPLIYLIHGGPQGAWLDEWHARWNYAMFAARGYVIAAVNFHGSTGYGQRFTNSISRHWGGAPYTDLMKGLDVVAALPYVDRNRMGAAGASYGGYMIYWLAGHTDRFKALVAHDGVFNTRSMFGSTEELWFPTHEFGGTPLSPSARALLERWSPSNFIDRWSTPMLIVHSQQDFRVDVSEGYQAFTALELRHVPGKFLYFPDEGHWVVKPRNRRLWWGTVLDWLDTYLAPASATSAAPSVARPR
ncbi:MAG TPA: S9 family peptidase [Gemmatimonadales bacterium]|nr:S9 family peptidase [Gemmatimonadales bacterium]